MSNARRRGPAARSIPIALAATRPGMARLAGRVADSVYFNVIYTESYVRGVLTPAVTEGAPAETRSFGRSDVV